jgi:hypothetical protein
MAIHSSFSSVILLAVTFAACGPDNKTQPIASMNKTETAYPAKPADAHLSKLQVQEQIHREIREALSTATDSLVTEAAVVVAETHNAIRYLLDSNKAAALRSIETATGKAEVLTHTKPNLNLVPLQINISVHDLVADMDVLKQIRDDAEDLTDRGYLQDARRLLTDIASELSISTSDLPLGTYPDALKEAARLTRENHTLEAALILSTALNTIVTEERDVPLPLIRAEAYLKQVDSLLGTNANTDQVDLLLDNADYQIRFAEALGYGKRDKEFEEFYDAIKSLRSEVKKKDRNARKSNSDLRSKLNSFKTRISPKTQTSRK